MSEKSKKLYMIGYCSNGYRLWDSEERKIVRARDIIFNEERTTEPKKIIYLDPEIEKIPEERNE